MKLLFLPASYKDFQLKKTQNHPIPCICYIFFPSFSLTTHSWSSLANILRIVQSIEPFSLSGFYFFFPCLLQDWKLDYGEGKFTWRQAKEEQRNMASLVMERPTEAGNAKEKVKKQLEWEPGEKIAGRWFGKLLEEYPVDYELSRGMQGMQEQRQQKPLGVFWSKALPQLCTWNFFPLGWKVNSSMLPYLRNSFRFCQVNHKSRSKTSKIRI